MTEAFKHHGSGLHWVGEDGIARREPSTAGPKPLLVIHHDHSIEISDALRASLVELLGSIIREANLASVVNLEPAELKSAPGLDAQEIADKVAQALNKGFVSGVRTQRTRKNTTTNTDGLAEYIVSQW